LIRIKKRKERIHKEILQRIHQNASFEMNWKHSIGFHATESVIMSGYFHRHKLVKDRLKNVFKRICIMNSIGNYWKQIVLVKQKLKQQSSTFSSYGSHPNNSTTNDSNETENQFSDDLHSVFNTNGETSVQLLSNLHHDEKTSSSNTTSTIYQKDKKRMSKEIPPREELLARQKEYTKRLHENQKRLHAHRLLIEKQKEIIRQIEVKKRLNEMETNNKQTKNRTSSTSQKKQVLLVEKRGLFQEIYQKNKEEIRRQKEIEAHEKIAQEMLSDQTQQILLQKKKKSLSIAYTSTEDNE
jgi:hypothetical protein